MRIFIILLMLTTCGCAAAAPVALGTGSAVADIILGEAIRAGAASVAPQVVAMAGLDRLARFGGRPAWAKLIPGSRPKVRVINGMTFVGDGW